MTEYKGTSTALPQFRERLRQLGAFLGPLMRPTTQADRDGMLISRHFQTSDALGIPRERAMEILREELWKLGRPMADRVRAATERLSREEVKQ
jgi:hypothetical protein